MIEILFQLKATAADLLTLEKKSVLPKVFDRFFVVVLFSHPFFFSHTFIILFMLLHFTMQAGAIDEPDEPVKKPAPDPTEK